MCFPQPPDRASSLQTPDEQEALVAIKEAFDLGINFWDTAPFYGAGSAERVMHSTSHSC